MPIIAKAYYVASYLVAPVALILVIILDSDLWDLLAGIVLIIFSCLYILMALIHFRTKLKEYTIKTILCFLLGAVIICWSYKVSPFLNKTIDNTVQKILIRGCTVELKSFEGKWMDIYITEYFISDSIHYRVYKDFLEIRNTPSLYSKRIDIRKPCT